MKVNLLTTFLMISVQIWGQDLARRADWQAQFRLNTQGPGTTIMNLDPDSPLKDAGFRVGDIILEVNNQKITSDEEWTSATYAIRSNDITELLSRRGANVSLQKVELHPLGLESHEDLDTFYDQVTSDYGIRQRVIITKPQGIRSKQPAIFMVQGLSCSTIEKYSGRGGNWVNQINDIVEKSNMVVMRVDKPGVGDSEGNCAETDFITELEGYKAALRKLKSLDYVDTTKIIIYGASMGSALAPYLANQFQLAGVISDGTFFKTWFEHMLEIERRIRQMSGDNESAIVRKMNQAFIPLYYGMLIEKKDYKEILERYPAIMEYNYHPSNHMYGRPLSYYHQLQDFDLAGEWEKLQVPVRILYGSNDWIMSEFDNHMIMKVLDQAGHEDHELLIYPGLDHWNTIHQTAADSFTGQSGVWDPKVPEIIIGWAKSMVN